MLSIELAGSNLNGDSSEMPFRMACISQTMKHNRVRRSIRRSACRLRLRPILMTSFAFILGVLPLMLARGAGAEMRQSLGTAVFFGMLGVTFFGLILTPVFYVVIRRFASKKTPIRVSPAGEPQASHS
jgi:Cu/Ag efflux pump CusA